MSNRLAERFLQRTQGFKDGDGQRDSSMYLVDHSVYVDVVGDGAAGPQPAFVIRGLNNDTNAPTEIFRVNKDGSLSFSVNVNIQVGDLSSSYVPNTSRNLPNGFAGLDASLMLNPIWLGNLGATYQSRSERDQIGGYPTLDGSSLIQNTRIGNLAVSYQGINGKNASGGYPGLDASLFIANARIGDLSGSYLTSSGKNAASGYPGLNGSVVMNPTQFNDGRALTFEHFGGSTAASSVANTAAQNSAWAGAQAWLNVAGGTLLWGIGTYDNLPQMILPNRTTFHGAGHRATVLKAKDNINGSGFILNVAASTANAQFMSLRSFMLDGNKAHQTTGDGIFWTVYPNNGFAAAGDDDFDSHNVISDVWVYNVQGIGLHVIGRSSNTYSNVQVYYSDGVGIIPSFDTLLHGCVTGQTGQAGIQCANSNMRFTGCDTFYAGNVTAGSGSGWRFVNISNGGVNLSSCIAQDCRGAGFLIDTSQGITMAACTSDSCATSFAGTVPGLDMFFARHCNIDLNCLDRQWDGATNTQTRAVRVRSSSVNNRIRLTHWAAAGSVAQPVLTWDTNCTPNDVSINGCTPGFGLRNATFATTFSLSPIDGNAITVLMTGSIALQAINAGAQFAGQNLRYTLKQGAGGFGVTLNAVYHPNTLPTVNTTASSMMVMDYQFDGTNYMMTNFQQGILA